MAEFASKGIAGTGLGLGIAGTALGLLNNSNLLNNNNNDCNHCNNCNGCNPCSPCNPCVTQRESEMQSRISELESQQYTDKAILTSYKDTYKQFTAQDEKIGAVVKDTTGALIKTGEAVAKLKEQVACLTEQVNAKFDSTNQRLNYEISAARTEAANLVAMEGERRACGDEKIISYVDGTFIPGVLKLPEREIYYGRCRACIEKLPDCKPVKES